MLKKLLFTIIGFCISVLGFSQSAQSTFTIISQTTNELVISVKSPNPVFKEIKGANPSGYKVLLKGGSSIMKKGFPDIDKLTTSVICPTGTKWVIDSIVPGSYTDYMKPVIPSKGNVSRAIDINALPFTYDAFYKSASVFPSVFAETREPYVLRDYVGQTIIVYPVQYIPSIQTVRKFEEITITLKAVSDNSLPSLQGRVGKAIVRDYNEIYKNQFLNYGNILTQKSYTPLGEDGDMLIICCDSFMNAMQPFISWKTQRGLNVYMANVDSIGNTSPLIKSYILNYYDTHNLSFVLLVGDASRVVNSQTSNGYSDNEYGYLVGNDSYPDVIMGRFSAQTVSEVTTQVTKTIQYEKYPAPGAAWYTKGIGMGSYEGDPDGFYPYGLDALADWAFERQLIRPQLLAYTYSNVSQLYDGADASNDPTATDLINQINSGASVINYTGHGSYNQILTTGFSVSNVPSLTNNNMFPFMIVVGCQTGDFVGNSNPCLAEALAWGRNANGPTGTIASFMSTTLQSWEPPMEGQAAFDSILTEHEPGNIKHTFGGIAVNACIEMNEMFGADGEAMTDTWVCFGDPSVVVRTDTPAAITATYPATVPLGTSSLVINCNTDGVLASLTFKGQILATAIVAGGVADFSFTGITVPDTIHICITAYNDIPFFGAIPVVPENQDYVILNSYSVDDSTGNNNGKPDYGENDALIISLENVGTLTANNIKGVLSTNDPYITIIDSVMNLDSLAAGVSTPSIKAFNFTISDSVPDQHVSLFNLRVSDSKNNIWNSPLVLVINAPHLIVTAHIVIDKAGLDNGSLNPGEADTIIMITKNTGHSNAVSGTAILTSSGKEVTIINSPVNGNAIMMGSIDSIKFQVDVSPDAILYSLQDFNYNYTAGYYNCASNFEQKIGNAMERFETNNFKSFDWILEGGDSAWFTTTENPYEGKYCAQSGRITNSESSTLAIQIYSFFDDSVSFAYRVSSEDGFDFLYFYIDSTVYGQWSGEVPWERVTYPVTAGGHMYKWMYSKDLNFSAGEDAAWLDAIDLPISELATFVNNVEVENDFIIAPNPAANNLEVQYILSHPALVSIGIYNILGQKVMDIANRQNTGTSMQTVSINTSDLVSGNYFICFNVNGTVYTRKLIVSK